MTQNKPPVDDVDTQTKKTSKKQSESTKDLNLLQKINCIRKAWSETELSKEGAGKAGGGAKYDYYKPQQVIDFCLEQELKHDIFSEFKVDEQRGMCFYNLIDIPTGEIRNTECPFEVPRKMAASEAQQVGAAMTYFNRRLAMMMYKIEDNSKENNSILGDADYSSSDIPAPPIPAPPIVTPPPAPVAQTSVEKKEEITTEEIMEEVKVAFNLPPQDGGPKETPKTVITPPPPPPVAPVNNAEVKAPGSPLSTAEGNENKAIGSPLPTTNKQNIEALYD